MRLADAVMYCGQVGNNNGRLMSFCQLGVLYRVTKAGLDWFYHTILQSLLVCQTIG